MQSQKIKFLEHANVGPQIYFYYFFVGNVKIYKHNCYSDLEDQKKYRPNSIKQMAHLAQLDFPNLDWWTIHILSCPVNTGFLWSHPLQDLLKIRGTGKVFNPTLGCTLLCSP